MKKGFLIHYTNSLGNGCISKFVTTQQEVDEEIAHINASFPRISKFHKHDPKPFAEPWEVK